MYELNFHSYVAPITVEDFKQEARKITEVELFENDTFLKGFSVVLNPKDKDNKALGQKYAMRKLVSSFASRENLKVRKELWKLFKHYSHACGKIMGD